MSFHSFGKLVLNVLASTVLLIHVQRIGHIASVAATTSWSSADLHGLRIQLVADAAAALVVLLVATALSIVKPAVLSRFAASELSTQAHG